MRVATAGEELFGQRNKRDSLAHRLSSVRVQGTSPGRHHSSASVGLLQADARRTRKHILTPGPSLSSKCVIRGILSKRPAEIGLRAERFGRGKSIQRDISSLRTLQGIVPFIVDKGESRTAHTRRKREQRDFAGVKPLREVAGLNQTEIPAIGNRIGSRTRPRLKPGISELLPQIDLPLQSLRRERSHIQTVVVENCVDQLEFVAVK